MRAMFPNCVPPSPTWHSKCTGTNNSMNTLRSILGRVIISCGLIAIMRAPCIADGAFGTRPVRTITFQSPIYGLCTSNGGARAAFYLDAWAGSRKTSLMSEIVTLDIGHGYSYARYRVSNRLVVKVLSISSDGKRMITVSRDRSRPSSTSTWQQWNTINWTCTRTCPSLDVKTRLKRSGLQLLVCSDDLRYGACKDLNSRRIGNQYCIVDMHNGETIRKLEYCEQEYTEPIKFTPDNRLLVGEAQIWKVQTGKLENVFGQTLVAAISPDGSIVVTAWANGLLNIFDTGYSNRILNTIALNQKIDLSSVVVSNDNRLIAFATADSVEVWDIKTAGEFRLFPLRRTKPCGLSFTGDNKRLSAWEGSRLLIWNLGR